MEHTISLHDSTPEPSTPEPFELPSYESYEEPTQLHPFAAADPVSVDDGWVQEEVPAEAVAEVEYVEHHEHHEHETHETFEPQSYEAPVFEHQPFAQNGHVEQHEHEHVEHAPVFGTIETEHRVVLQLTGGETVELRRFTDSDEAVEFARDCVRRIAAAEATGEWPEIDGRFLRPDSIFSVDVQVSE